MKKQNLFRKELREHIRSYSTRFIRKYIWASVVTFFFSLCTIFSQDTWLLKKHYRNFKILDVTIGEKNYIFLFDIGGVETFISPRIAMSLGKTLYSKVSGLRMNGEMITYQQYDSINFEIGKTAIYLATVPVSDLMSILLKELPRLDGIISFKTFALHQISLDLAHNRIILETATSFRNKIKNTTPLHVRFANGLMCGDSNVFIGIKKNNRLYWFLFESGNLDKFRFSSVIAFEWGLKKDTASKREEFKNVIIPFVKKNFIVNGVSENIIYDGALNFEYIQQSVYFIDLVNKKVWVI